MISAANRLLLFVFTFLLTWNLFQIESHIYATGISIDWVNDIATPNTGNDFGQRTTVDSHGNVFIVGYSNGKSLYNSTNLGDYDVFTAKYSKNGTLIWGRYFGTSYRDQSFAIALDINEYPVISGYTQGSFGGINVGGKDIFIAKFDKNNGTTLFTNMFGGPRDESSYGIAVDPVDNGIVVAGFTTGNLTSGLNQGLEDSFIVKFNATGAFQWVQMFGTNGSDKANGLVIDPNRNIFVTGSVTSGVFDVGYGNRDSWVIKFNYTGGMQWVHQFGSNDTDTFYDIDYDSEHNVVSCGQVNGPFFGNTWSGLADAACISFDTKGKMLWTSVVGSSGHDIAEKLSIGRTYNTPTGGSNLNDSIFVGGYSDGDFYPFMNNGSDDMFFYMLNNKGQSQWVYLLGGIDEDEAAGITYDAPSGKLYIVGYFSDNIPGVANATGGFDAILMLWSPPWDDEDNPSPNDNTSGGSGGSSVDTAVVVGASLGSAFGLFLIVVVVGGVFYFSRRNRNKKMLALLSSEDPWQESQPISENSMPAISYGSTDAVFEQRNRKATSKDNTWEINYGELILEKKIGQGASGIVYRGKWRKTEVACKQLLITKATDKDIENFRAEAELMRNLRPNKNVLLYYGICTNPLNPLCIVTEYMPNGNLWVLLQNSSFKWTNALKLKIIKGVANGMYHLAKEKLVHRDLAARNILLTENLDAKISDFGLSRTVENEDDSNQTVTNVGPIRWMSPEAIMQRVYSEKSDVWSFGVLVYEVLTQSQPYPGVSQLQVAAEVGNRLLRLNYPKNLPVISELLDRCLDWEADNRPRFEEIVEILDGVVVNDADQFVESNE